MLEMFRIYVAGSSNGYIQHATRSALFIDTTRADNSPRTHKARSSWEEKLRDLIWSFDDNQPRFRHEQWRKVFDQQIESNPISLTTSANPLFALPLGENIEEWEIWMSKEAVWDRYSTLSQIAILEGEERKVSGLVDRCKLSGY